MARAAVLRVQRVPHLSRRVVWSVVRRLAPRVCQLPNGGRRTAHDVERAAFCADSIQLRPRTTGWRKLEEQGDNGKAGKGNWKRCAKSIEVDTTLRLVYAANSESSTVEHKASPRLDLKRVRAPINDSG